MGVMMLAAAKGTTINIETDGPDEEAAMTALTGLIADYFGEGESNSERSERGERRELRADRITGPCRPTLHA